MTIRAEEEITLVRVDDGTDGADGVSPTATVTKSGDTATITITDKNGTTTETVSDGADGQDGQDGQDGVSPVATVTKSGDTATITITDATQTTSASVTDGTDGQDGQDGTSAYEAAQQGGYSGTEAEFNSDLAQVSDVTQHFWYDTDGAHVTEVDQDTYVTDPTTAGPNVLIDSDGMDILDGTENLAHFGDYARIGGDGSTKVLVSPASVSMANSDGVEALRMVTLDKTRTRTVTRSIGAWIADGATLTKSYSSIIGEVSSGFTVIVIANGSPEASEVGFTKGTSATRTVTYGGGVFSITYNGSDGFTFNNSACSEDSFVDSIRFEKTTTWSRIEIDGTPLDYVVEAGVNADGWNYTLWASGRAEAWLEVSYTGKLSTSNGGWYANGSTGVPTANIPDEIFTTANNGQNIYRSVTAYCDLAGQSSSRITVTPILYDAESGSTNRYFGDVLLVRGSSYTTSKTYIIDCHVTIMPKSNWQDYI